MSGNKFAITLDRPSGVYYAGEVITGELTLRANGEACRSVLLSCVGKASVHWHTGSGDNRKDFDGKKLFMESERTLWGNFYRTTVLDNAGSDAQFGGAFGDGDMYIPCLASEGSNGTAMRLIVRVCDYDWGKKDDNCGEVVIDANKLAKEGDSMTYNLTRNGKPEQGSITLVANFVPTSALTRDSSENNFSIKSSETLILKVLKANDLRKADWFGKNDVYVQAWRAPDDLPMPPPPRKKLPEPDKKIKLPNQTMTFKFAFPTRPSAPGSAVLKCGDRSYIAYYIKAEIDKKGWRNPSLKFPITIIPTRPAPLPALLCPTNTEEEDQIKKCHFCCFSCCEAGSIQMKFTCDRRAYAPGETVNLRGSTILNNSSILISARIVLRQHIQLTTTDRYHHTHNGTQRFELGSVSVEPGAQAHLSNLTLKVPAVPPSFFGSQGSSTAYSEPLIFTYELSLQAKAGSGHKVKIDLPILISALPPKVTAIEAAIHGNSPVLTNSFEIVNYAVLDDVPCDTVPVVTGLEDSNGQLAPTATGAANIYEPNDIGSLSNTYNYEPQVVVFPSHEMTATEPSMDGGITNSSAHADVDHTTAYNTLLERIKIEYDTRATVDNWMKEYPSVAASLTPDEFAGALKNVLFSLEQATVARELTSGMGPGLLTTNHIIASIEACPYAKIEIVRVMAPYVCDPQNKEMVLSKLYSFERDEAEKCFSS